MVKKRVVLSICLGVLVLFFVVSYATTRATGTSAPPPVIDEPSVIFKEVTDLSSGGGYLQAIMSDDDIQHLYVRLYGVMGQVGFSYSFIGDNSVIIYITRENYTEPFYLMPPGVLHVSSIERERYLLFGDRFYIIIAESSELHETTEEVRNKIIEEMNGFIERVSVNDRRRHYAP